MNFVSNKLLNVYLNFSKESFLFVGRLAIKDQKIWFEYDTDFTKSNLAISPFKLPLQAGVNFSKDIVFEGLYGAFNDSLPDAWGRLLIDRKLRKLNIEPNAISPLDRLSLIGDHGFGALVYKPEQNFDNQNFTDLDINLDNLYSDSLKILEGKANDSIDEMLSFSGSAGGARPKINILFDKNKKEIFHPQYNLENNYEQWLIKFSANQDLNDLGVIEYAYSSMAKKAGIEMTDTYLFSTKKNAGYFGTKRFDKEGLNRLHAHTASGLLHADHRYPSLDYENLLKTTLVLTKDINEVTKVYRLAVFNVLAYNRDDHAKNFSFLMDDKGVWKFAPAYDLTFSYGPGGEHSMMVCGEGKNPGNKEFTELARKFEIKNHKEIIETTKEAVSQWKSIAKSCNVSSDSIKLIGNKLKETLNA